MKLKDIKEVALELNRFSKRLQDAKLKFEADDNANQGCKESAALKRGAFDLKNELTKLTK